MAGEQWLTVIRKADKTAVLLDGKRQVHFLLSDGREMVEEYNWETNVLMRRAWREKGEFGQHMGWNVEIGDPQPKQSNFVVIGIEESSNTPFITRRITKSALEWRIRNLPYPQKVYSVTAEDDGSIITVRTTNKKYFKKMNIPDLERAGLKAEQERISFKHQYNTLIISYKKPPALLDFEKQLWNEIMQITVRRKADVDCPTS